MRGATGFLGMLLWLLLALLGCRPQLQRPNIVFILIDALRADHLGSYGYERPTSPCLDKLAGQGLLFERIYAQAPQTFRSTGTLFTSRHFPLLVDKESFQKIPGLSPRKQAEFEAIRALAPNNLLITEILRDNGYQTAAIFTNPHHHAGSGFWQGLDYSEYLAPEEERGYPIGELVNRAVLDYLGRPDPDGVREPFFLYAHYMDVHNPYRPPDRYADLFVKEPGVDRYMNGIPTGDRVPTAKDLAYMRALYDAEIRYVDDMICELHQEIGGLFPESRTVFVITSDHGDEFMDHGGLGHGTTLEIELLHVPLVIVGLEDFKPRRISAVASNLDVAPTLLQIAGIEVPDLFEGRSLLPLAAQSGQPPRSSFASYRGLQSITTERWHFFLDRRSENTRLYDLDADPRGLTDATDAHRGVAAESTEKLDRYNKAYRRALSLSQAMTRLRKDSEAEIDPQVLEQLRALGYLE